MCCIAAAAQSSTDLAIDVLDGGAAVIRLEGLVTDYQRKSITQARPLVLTFIARNLGSVPATDVTISTVFSNPGPGTIAVDPSPTCPSTIGADVAPGRRVAFTVGSLAAGASRSCTVTLSALPAAPRTYVRITASVRSATTGETFQNNNDIRPLQYGLSPTDVVQDWALEVARPSGLFPPGSSSTVDVTLRNLGPQTDPSPSVQIVLSDLFAFGDSAGPSGRFTLRATSDSDCTVAFNAIVGDFGGVANLQIDFEPVSVGGARTCSLAVSALPGAVGQFSLLLTATNTTPGGFDPDFSNNSARIVFQFTALAVPMLTPLGIALLCLGVAVVARVRRRHL